MTYYEFRYMYGVQQYHKQVLIKGDKKGENS